MTVIRAAITQTTWTGDKMSMLDKHEQFAREARAQEAQVICFQELFYGPYFGITEDVKYYDYAEPDDGPVVQRFAALAAELSMVMVLPIFEEEQPGVYYNPPWWSMPTAPCSGNTARTTSRTSTSSGRSSTSVPAISDIRCSRAPSVRSGSTSADRHFPEGWRELGLNGAQIVFNPNATKPGLSNRLWEIEQPAAAAANGYFIAAPNRVGREDNEYGELAVTFYGSSQFCDPQGNVVGQMGSDEHEEVVVRDLDLEMIRQVRNAWQFYRDRRPDSYAAITQP